MTEQPNAGIEGSPQDAQIEKRRRNFSGRGEVEITRVIPFEVGKNPETQEPLRPFVFLHGFRQDKTVEAYLQLIANTGRVAIGVTYPGSRRSRGTYPKKIDGFETKMPGYQFEKAEDVLDALDESGIEEVDIVDTSEGDLRGTIATALDAKRDKRIRNVISVHPAAKDNKGYWRTAANVAKYYGRQFLAQPGRSLRHLSDHVSHVREKEKSGDTQLLKRTGRILMKARENRVEQVTIAHSKLHSLPNEARRENPNLRFGMIADRADTMFPPERLQKFNGDYLDAPLLVSEWGGHGIGLVQGRINQINQLAMQLDKTRAREGQ